MSAATVVAADLSMDVAPAATEGLLQCIDKFEQHVKTVDPASPIASSVVATANVGISDLLSSPGWPMDSRRRVATMGRVLTMATAWRTSTVALVLGKLRNQGDVEATREDSSVTLSAPTDALPAVATALTAHAHVAEHSGESHNAMMLGLLSM